MGYDARCEGDIELKNGVSEERIAEIKNILQDIYEDVVFCNDVGFNDNRFSVIHNDKYYEDETLEALRRIANDVEEAKIDYEGEDGQEWAFTIKNGNIYELTGRDEPAYKNSTLIYEGKTKEPSIVKTFSYTLETTPDVIMEFAFNKKDGLNLEEMLLEELWNAPEYFVESLMNNLLYDEINNGEYDETLENYLGGALENIKMEKWSDIVSISDVDGYDIDTHDNRVQIWTSVDIDMEELYKNIAYHLVNENLTQKDIERLLNEPVKDISWINGEFKVTTVGDEHFTIHKDGSVTIDDEMQEFDKADMKNKNKGVER